MEQIKNSELQEYVLMRCEVCGKLNMVHVDYQDDCRCAYCAGALTEVEMAEARPIQIRVELSEEQLDEVKSNLLGALGNI